MKHAGFLLPLVLLLGCTKSEPAAPSGKPVEAPAAAAPTTLAATAPAAPAATAPAPPATPRIPFGKGEALLAKAVDGGVAELTLDGGTVHVAFTATAGTVRLVAAVPGDVHELHHERSGTDREFGLFADGTHVVAVMMRVDEDGSFTGVSAWRYRWDGVAGTLVADGTFTSKKRESKLPAWMPDAVVDAQGMATEPTAHADALPDEDEVEYVGADDPDPENPKMHAHLHTKDGHDLELAIVQEPGDDMPGVQRLLATEGGKVTEVFVDDRTIGAEQVAEVTVLPDGRVKLWAGQIRERVSYEIEQIFRWDAAKQRLVKDGKAKETEQPFE